jgi:FkbM family methyltransferase
MTAPATRAPPVREIPGAALALARRNWEADRAGKEHGVANLQHLLGLLAEIEPVGGRHRVVIDIGGNVGQTTSRLMHEIVRKKSSGHFHMYTFEPMTAYDTIVARARAENWTAHRYTVFQCAVGLKPGTAKFYFDNDTSEQSSQDSSAAGTAKFTRQVPIINMDQFFYEGVSRDIVRWGTPRNTTNDSYGSHDIFFYKMDTEGYDMDVLDGSHRLLTEKRARFIEFEYNGKWFSLGRTRTLKQVTRDLYERYDYECYFISEKYLHPLFGVWWHSDMEIREWSNVFCGLRHDHLLHWIVRRFDHQDFGALSPIDTIEFSALTGNP